jgi:hypothetical protein
MAIEKYAIGLTMSIIMPLKKVFLLEQMNRSARLP